MGNKWEKEKWIFIFLFKVYICFSQPFDRSVEYIFPDEKPFYNLIGWKTACGDSAIWADTSYDDLHWSLTSGVGLWVYGKESGKGVRWYRKTLFFPEPLDSLATLALYQVAVVSANEIFWDGTLIARNGIPGKTREDEKTGLSGQVFTIPKYLTNPGKHLIAMRVSNFHSFSGVIDAPLQIGYFKKLHEHLINTQAFSIFLAGIFFITALFHFFILLGHGNKWPYALFCAYSLSCAIYIFIRGMLRYFQIDLKHYYLLANLNDVPWFFMIVLLPVFFLFEFGSPYKKRITGIIICAGLIVVVFPRLITLGIVPISWLNTFESANMIHVYFTMLISIIVAFWALLKKKIGSLSAFIGLIAFLAGVYFSSRLHVENAWGAGFAVLNFFLMFSLSKQMAHRRRLLHEADLHNARLEIELLKKHIQPHFLLNSLNSIVAWLEENPSVAAKLVNALADEMRMLLDFSKKRLVSLYEEIDLCKAHLQVMSLRQEKSYSLDVKGEYENVFLPPLIIHTLVENGLTHGYRGRDNGIFRLECSPFAEGWTRIILFNDSVCQEIAQTVKEGTGLRYVKTRLEEVFPSQWNLTSAQVEGGWKVEIDFKGEE